MTSTTGSRSIWKRISPRPSKSLLRRDYIWAPNWPSLCLRPRIWNTCSDNVLVPQQGRWPPARVGKPFSWDCRSPTEEKGYQRFCFSFGVCTRVGRCQRKDQEVSVCLSSFTSSATSIWANMTLTDVFFFSIKGTLLRRNEWTTAGEVDRTDLRKCTHHILSKVLVYYCFLVFRRIGE